VAKPNKAVAVVTQRSSLNLQWKSDGGSDINKIRNEKGLVREVTHYKMLQDQIPWLTGTTAELHVCVNLSQKWSQVEIPCMATTNHELLQQLESSTQSIIRVWLKIPSLLPLGFVHLWGTNGAGGGGKCSQKSA